MRAILVLAAKDIRLLLRDRAAAFFTFAFPVAIALLFGYVFSGTTGEPLQVAVLVERDSAAARAFVGLMESDGAFAVARAATRERGEAMVRGTEAIALVTVPADWEERLAGVRAGGSAGLRVEFDPARRAEGGLLVGKMHELGFRAAFGEAAAAWKPVTVEASEMSMERGVPANSFAISFSQGVAWALFGAVLSFCAGIAEERQRGTLVRLLVSPMRPASILLGKAVACFLACMAAEWLLVAVGAAFFGVSVSSWAWLAVASAATAFGFSGVMMLLAGGFRTQGGAQGAGRAVLLVLAMLGGGTVPLVFMPGFLRTLSDVSPFKWAVLVAEGCTWRAWGAAEMWMPLAALVAIGAVGLASGAALVRRTA
jgi:ABC-2 type transport system permease protein